jgi:hypothetical protein
MSTSNPVDLITCSEETLSAESTFSITTARDTLFCLKNSNLVGEQKTRSETCRHLHNPNDYFRILIRVTTLSVVGEQVKVAEKEVTAIKQKHDKNEMLCVRKLSFPSRPFLGQGTDKEKKVALENLLTDSTSIKKKHRPWISSETKRKCFS